MPPAAAPESAAGGPAAVQPAAAVPVLRARAAALPADDFEPLATFSYKAYDLIGMQVSVPAMPLVCTELQQPCQQLCGQCIILQRVLGRGTEAVVMLGKVVCSAGLPLSAPAHSTDSSSSSSSSMMSPSDTCSDGVQQQQQRAQQPWQVAVKCLLPAAWDGKYSPQEQQRHCTEFTVMSVLGNRKVPHILPLLAEEVLVRGQQKLVCMVTELQQSCLYTELCRGYPFSEGAMQHVARQILQALQGIADAGVMGGFAVVHRDLKCSNLLLTEDGDVVLADFGTSSYQKLAEGSAAEMLHELIGTPYHMSPAIVSGTYGPEVDLFSLGNCMVEMVSVKPQGIHKDLRDLGCGWEFGAGGQAAWMEWLGRFARGEVKQKLPGVKGHGMGTDSLRGFVAACCFPPATAEEQQQDAWSAHRDRLRTLLQHSWLQPAAT